MAGLSDYLEDALLNATLRNTTFPAPTANVYVALFTGDPLDTGAGPEVSGGSYARVAVSTTGGWTAPSGGMSQNVAAISFAAATAAWGTVTHVAIFDQITGGNLLFHGQLSTSKAVANGDNFRFEIGALNVTVA